MKPWIPLLAGLSVSGAVMVALWLEDPPPPMEFPEVAAPLPPSPPAPLVRAVVSAPPPSPVTSPAPTPVPEPAREELPEALAEEAVPTSLDPLVAEPTNPATRLRRAQRISQMLQGRQKRLREQLEAARVSGDPQAEAKALAQVERSEERMEKVRLQVEQLRAQAADGPARQ